MFHGRNLLFDLLAFFQIHPRFRCNNLISCRLSSAIYIFSNLQHNLCSIWVIISVYLLNQLNWLNHYCVYLYWNTGYPFPLNRYWTVLESYKHLLQPIRIQQVSSKWLWRWETVNSASKKRNLQTSPIKHGWEGFSTRGETEAQDNHNTVSLTTTRPLRKSQFLRRKDKINVYSTPAFTAGTSRHSMWPSIISFEICTVPWLFSFWHWSSSVCHSYKERTEACL